MSTETEETDVMSLDLDIDNEADVTAPPPKPESQDPEFVPMDAAPSTASTPKSKTSRLDDSSPAGKTTNPQTDASSVTPLPQEDTVVVSSKELNRHKEAVKRIQEADKDDIIELYLIGEELGHHLKTLYDQSFKLYDKTNANSKQVRDFNALIHETLAQIKEVNRKGEDARGATLDMFELLEVKIQEVSKNTDLTPLKDNIDKTIKGIESELPIKKLNSLVFGVNEGIKTIQENIKTLSDDVVNFNKRSSLLREDLLKYIKNLESLIKEAKGFISTGNGSKKSIITYTIFSSLTAFALTSFGTYHLIGNSFDNKLTKVTNDLSMQLANAKLQSQQTRSTPSPLNKYTHYFTRKNGNTYFRFNAQTSNYKEENGNYLIEVKGK